MQLDSGPKYALGLGIVCTISVLVTGCHRTDMARPLSFYDPTNVPYKNATLTIMGTDIPVSMDVRKESTSMVVFLRSEHGEVLEHEAYKFDDGAFALWRAGGELYDPAIPILKDPVMLGDHWTWKGKMVAALDGVPSNIPTATRDAIAEITLSEDKINVVGGPFDAMKVEVKLSMDGGGKSAAERVLNFWFMEKRGLVKREFAASSTRSEDGGLK